MRAAGLVECALVAYGETGARTCAGCGGTVTPSRHAPGVRAAMTSDYQNDDLVLPEEAHSRVEDALQDLRDDAFRTGVPPARADFDRAAARHRLSVSETAILALRVQAAGLL